jgi:hypothetical protein
MPKQNTLAQPPEEILDELGEDLDEYEDLEVIARPDRVRRPCS